MLNLQPFFKDELIFAISSKRKESKTKNIQPKDLSKFDFLSYPLRFDLCYRTVEAKFGSHLAQCHIPIETESFDTLKQMLLLGVGATFIPKYLIAKELKSGELAEINVGQNKLPITFSIVSKKDADLSKATRCFIKTVTDFFSI
jgi:DNA-binding transcriptional LysR family regulator